MDAFFQWLNSNPIATTVLIIFLGTLLIIYIAAFVQGREISYWPPKIGAKPSSESAKKSDKTNPNDLVKIFSSNEEALSYMTQKMNGAKHNIELAHLNDRGSPDNSPSLPIYKESRFSAIRNSAIKFNHVALINQKRIEEAYRFRIVEKAPYYNVGFYSPDPKSAIPSLTFTIFDREEVIVRPPYEDGEDERYTSIKDPNIVALFHQYFEKLMDKSDQPKSDNDFHKLFEFVKNKITATENRP